MSTTKKLLLFLWTILPVLYFFAFMAFVSFSVFSQKVSGAPFDFFPYLFVVHMLFGFCGMALIAYYLIYLFKRSGLQGNDQIMWLVLLLMLGPFGMLAFWYVNIWKKA